MSFLRRATAVTALAVVNGAIPVWRGRLLLLGLVVALPVILFGGATQLRGATLAPWIQAWPALEPFLPIGILGFVAAVLWSCLGVLTFLENRTATISVYHDGLIWTGQLTVIRPRGLIWSEIAGFRDTPHPWIDIVGQNRLRHRIPIRSEEQRDRMLLLLAAFVPTSSTRPTSRAKPARSETIAP